MKKYVLLLLLGLSFCGVNGQLIRQESQGQKKQADLDWYNCSFDREGVYGAEMNKAYEFLKDKKIKKRPVVALIGTGLDVEHEDLKQSIWMNPKEKANGKDDDRNGLVDDINGWNFIGGKDGQVMETLTREGEREFLRLKEKYADYVFDGKNYYKVLNDKLEIVPAPEDMAEYKYFRFKVMFESTLASSYGGIGLAYILRDYALKFDKQMKERFPDKELTLKEFETCYDAKAPRDSLRDISFTLMMYGFSIMKTDKWQVIYDLYATGGQVERATASYEQNLKRLGYDGRKEMVGDNYLDINDSKYGNNVLLTSDAALGTMQAGIIGAGRGNGLGGDGTLDQVEMMALRVSTGSGEPYLKDIALAVRYAVDHGSDVIVLPEQNSLYPREQKQWVSEALQYAESKGVLVIVPVWELSRDLGKETFFPNRWMTGGKELTNLMVVASSDKEGNPSMNSNYGAKELDLFAPGIDVYSTYTGDTYQRGTGVGLASAAVAGVAALVKAYFPRLTGSQIRDILLETVTSRKGVEVEKGIVVDGKQTQDLFLFDDLCLSGGILNAYRAVVAASKLDK